MSHNDQSVKLVRAFATSNEIMRDLLAQMQTIRHRAHRELRPGSSDYQRVRDTLRHHYSQKMTHLSERVQFFDDAALRAFQQRLGDATEECERLFRLNIPSHAAIIAIIRANEEFFLGSTDTLKLNVRANYIGLDGQTKTIQPDDVMQVAITSLFILQ